MDLFTIENETEFAQSIGLRIRMFRRYRKLTQKELGTLLGHTNMVITAWERGKRRIDVINLRTLARALGTTAQFLLSDTFEEEFPKLGKANDEDHS